MAQPVRKRADGEASRRRILDAAAQIAGERGFHGTSISLVSARSGLPASSIYWHFADKDELIAAVIDRSYAQWIEALDQPVEPPEGAGPDEAFRHSMGLVGRTLAEFPDFLRLGLMLILDRNPAEPSARAKFLEVRRATSERIRSFYRTIFEELTEADIDQLTTLTIVLSDGTFIARDADALTVDHAYELMATAILATASRLATATAAAF